MQLIMIQYFQSARCKANRVSPAKRLTGQVGRFLLRFWQGDVSDTQSLLRKQVALHAIPFAKRLSVSVLLDYTPFAGKSKAIAIPKRGNYHSGSKAEKNRIQFA